MILKFGLKALDWLSKAFVGVFAYKTFKSSLTLALFLKIDLGRLSGRR